MTFQAPANLYTQGFGSHPERVEVPHYDVRDPATTDINYVIGKQWVNYVGNTVWFLCSTTSAGGTLSAVWVNAAGAVDQVSTINNLPPTNGNITIAATSPLTVSNAGSTVTLALPSSFLQATTITLTSAQIKALRGAPVSVVGSGGTGTSLLFFRAQLKFVYGGTNAFTNPQDLALQIGATPSTISTTITSTGFLDQTSNQYQECHYIATPPIISSANTQNAPIVIKNIGASEITGNAANDNTIIITTYTALLTQ